MTTICELDEAIEEIERVVVTRNKKPALSPHRWAQMLRILKFYRLKWDELTNDPLWDTDQSHPESPYYYRGMDEEHLRLAHRAHLEWLQHGGRDGNAYLPHRARDE